MRSDRGNSTGKLGCASMLCVQCGRPSSGVASSRSPDIKLRELKIVMAHFASSLTVSVPTCHALPFAVSWERLTMYKLPPASQGRATFAWHAPSLSSIWRLLSKMPPLSLFQGARSCLPLKTRRESQPCLSHRVEEACEYKATRRSSLSSSTAA